MVEVPVRSVGRCTRRFRLRPTGPLSVRRASLIDRPVLDLLCIGQSPGDSLDQLSCEVIAGEVARSQVLVEHHLDGDLICRLGHDKHAGHGLLLPLVHLKQFSPAAAACHWTLVPNRGLIASTAARRC